jgi:outer membrane lipoprotein-sorting protein
MPDEKVGGQDCFVVEAKSKAGTGPMQPERIVFYCRKDIGMLTKQVAYAKDGTVMNTLTFDDMKVNAKLGADKFKYTAPEGVKVVDQTGA